MNTKYIFSLIVLIALTGAQCWGAASNPNPETPIGSLARLYAESSADQAPRILASLSRKNLLQLAMIGHKKPQRFPMLYQDAMSELYRQKEKFQQFLQKYNGHVQAALSDAAKNNKPWAIDYLVQNGANVNARYTYGRTPLMWAASNGRDAVVAQLIAAGADFKTRDNNGQTALMWAARRCHEAVVARLIAAGADFNATDNDGQTALMEAASLGREAVVAQLLAAGADVNARDNNGRTAIMIAAKKGRENIVAQLIAAGANVNAKDIN